MIVLGQIAPAIKLPSSGSTTSTSTQTCSSTRMLLRHPSTGATRCVTACPSGYATVRDSRTNTKYCKPIDLRCSATQMVAIDERTWARRCVAAPIAKIPAASSPATVSPSSTPTTAIKPTGATSPAPAVPTATNVPATPGVVTTATPAPTTIEPEARPPLSRGAKIALGVGALSLVAGGAALFMTRR